MNDLAVRVEHLHKQYRLGSTHAHDGSLAGALSRSMRRLVGRRSVPPPADDTLWALRDVSFEIKKGEVFGVIGTNGSGRHAPEDSATRHGADQGPGDHPWTVLRLTGSRHGV
ncbi:MAG: hypothetical protein QM771_09585 [Nitrospira sp.]